jgi:xylulokinase
VPELLAGVDVGTSGVEVGIFDPAGRLEGFLGALRQACDKGHAEPGAIVALGLSVLFPAVAPLDARGRALHPALLYCDRRSLAQIHDIEEKIPRADYQSIIGNRLVPGTCAVTSMCWLRDERPHEYAAAKVLGFANTFLISCLTGEFFTDPSHMALSGLADVRDP